MKRVLIYLEEADYDRLLKVKGDKTWNDMLMMAIE